MLRISKGRDQTSIMARMATDRVVSAAMEYRGVRFTVLQGIARGHFTWVLDLDGGEKRVTGTGDSRALAIKRAMQAIDLLINSRRKRAEKTP